MMVQMMMLQSCLRWNLFSIQSLLCNQIYSCQAYTLADTNWNIWCIVSYKINHQCILVINSWLSQKSTKHLQLQQSSWILMNIQLDWLDAIINSYLVFGFSYTSKSFRSKHAWPRKSSAPIKFLWSTLTSISGLKSPVGSVLKPNKILLCDDMNLLSIQQWHAMAQSYVLTCFIGSVYQIICTTQTSGFQQQNANIFSFHRLKRQIGTKHN